MTPSEQSYREILLTKGQVAIVDAEDFERLSRFKWSSVWNATGKRFYAIRCVWIGSPNRVQTIFMHRFILGCEPRDNKIVDHINRDGLDNRRENLRIVTRQFNSVNSKLRIDNPTGYRGVRACRGRYEARIYVNGRCIHLGTFDSPIAASKAYEEAALKYFGA